jgi:Bacterial mobilisation protein (MobC)
MRKVAVLCRVDPATKEMIRVLASHEGVSEADLVRRLIDVGLGSIHEAKEPTLPSSPEGYQRKKITLTLPTFIVDLARERAAQKKMSLSRWIASLVQGSVFQPPVLTTTELKYLNESNRQIRAIGVNLNQIAKAFNKMDIDIRKFKNLDVVETLVRENLAVIERLMRAANRSWGVGRGHH